MTRARRARGVVLAALGAFALGGCGAYMNLLDSGGDMPAEKVFQVYGGTRIDLEQAERVAADTTGQKTGITDPTTRTLWRAYLLGIDLPLSAVVDTVTLPLTYCAAWEEHGMSVFGTGPEGRPDFDEPSRQPPSSGTPAAAAPK